MKLVSACVFAMAMATVATAGVVPDPYSVPVQHHKTSVPPPTTTAPTNAGQSVDVPPPTNKFAMTDAVSIAVGFWDMYVLQNLDEHSWREAQLAWISFALY